MRRTGSALALLGLACVLASCAITPPVLGGRPSGDGLWTDADLVALLIRDDPESENVVRDLGDYRDEVLADAADLDEQPCGDASAPLVLLDRDAAASGSIVESPPLFRDAPGADLLVTQVARRFASAADAVAFVEALRTARGDCREIVEGDFAVDAVGFSSERTSAGATTTAFEWVLVHENVALALDAELLDDDDDAVLDALAAEYATLLTE